MVYLFDNGLAPYASYSESFSPQSGTGYGGSVFKPTEGKQYEIGIKYQPPGSNSFITAAIFDLRQNNVPTMDPDPTHLCGNGRCQVQDGEVRSRGFELEGKASLNDNLDITAASRTSKPHQQIPTAPCAMRRSPTLLRHGRADQGTTTYAVPRHTPRCGPTTPSQDGNTKGFGVGAGARMSARPGAIPPTPEGSGVHCSMRRCTTTSAHP